MKGVFVGGSTGGHVYPALAVARESKRKGTEIYWIGKKNSLEQKLSLEEEFFFKSVPSGGFRGKRFYEKIISFFLLCSSFIISFRALKKIHPDFIFSCGGYTSLGPGLASFFLKIPLFIHEQNSIAGSANRLLSKMSEKTFEGFPSSFNSKTNTEYVGNPIREEISRYINESSSIKQYSDKKYSLLILGGSQGSKELNTLVMESFEEIKEKDKLRITHQTGESDLDKVNEFYSGTEVDFKVQAFINDIGKAYQKADLVISRAGAMTVTELIAMNKPSILIPLSWATDNHQFLNAKFMKEIGAAKIFLSNKDSSSKLASLISELVSDEERRLSMSNSAKLAFIPDVEKKIFKKIYESIKKKA